VKALPSGAGQALVTKVADLGIDGLGPLDSAIDVAEEHLRAAGGDVEAALRRLIATHTRIVGASGFAAGLGGAWTLPVAIPADLTLLYAYGARCAAAVAHLRGYDVRTEEVRSLVLLSLLGSAGAAVLAEVGVTVAQKSAVTALRRLPGRVLIDVNKKVGFRLLTKFGEKGVINLGKLVPLVGAPVGAGVNVATTRTVGTWARRNFPAADPPDAPVPAVVP
jgi:hypothetical protein